MSPRGRRRRSPGGVSEQARRRHGWLELLQTSGPFLTLPVVHRVFPDGPPPVPVARRAEVRAAVAEMLDSRGATRNALIETMLRDVLDWQDHLHIDTQMPENLAELVPEHGLWLRPDFGFYAEPDTGRQDEDQDNAGPRDAAADRDGETDELVGDDEADEEEEELPDTAGSADGPWRLLGMYLPWGQHPLARVATSGWAASGVERLAVLLRARQVPVGVATDGRWWALVWAPPAGTTGAAVWDAGLFSEDPASLQALVALVERYRFLSVPHSDTLSELFAESLERGEEVTESLGRQVREAVELLAGTLDRLDRESGGQLLAGVDDDTLYAGVVTMMMRVVFLLFAEERRLLPGDDDIYVSAYGVGQLVGQLERQASLAGEQTLEHRTAAWHRLLAVSRAVHSGVAHEDLRLPAYGGGLFDPGRYPWLEGRSADDATALTAQPPPVDDRTVLRMLRAVQYVQIGGERRRLTFRALDVEQIGYVYEGLLELEVRTAATVTLGLERPSSWPRKVKFDSEVSLADVADWTRSGDLTARLTERTGWSVARVSTALAASTSAEQRAAIVRVAGPDTDLVDAVAPLFGILRKDERGMPAVTAAGGRYVDRSSRRAATGTHYTPRSLAEEVAVGALEPLVYRPGPLDTADETKWRPRPSTQILELRIADIAMGSGAFLVAACRYLADRLVEAWRAEGRNDALVAQLHAQDQRIGADAEVGEVLLEARRKVAEHCLYGADINPLAVEMAKLSLWLITMDRERPFGFLDDRLVCGDSLLGLSCMDQLEYLHPDPSTGRRLNQYAVDLAAAWRPLLQDAADARRKITAQPVVTIRDVEHKARLLAEATGLSGALNIVADAITAEGLSTARLKDKASDAEFTRLAHRISLAMDTGTGELSDWSDRTIQNGRPAGTVKRQPLHWPLAFPEIFADTDQPGFDAIIGNPPFLGGQKISGTLGDDYLDCLQRWDGHGVRGSADLAARFVLRAYRLLSARGQLGYVTVNTLVEGATSRVGLEQLISSGLIIRAGKSPHPWPTNSASLQVVETWASKAPLARSAVLWLDGEEVPAIGPDLQPYGRLRERPRRLPENENIAFQGSNVVGKGFILTREQAQELIASNRRNSEVVEPYVIGRDLNQRADCSASRWIINFRGWPLSRAETYPECIDIVRRLVLPKRLRNKRSNYQEFWWRFGEHRPGLYEAVDKFRNVLALARISSVVMPVRVPVGQVFDAMCVVFAVDDLSTLAFLSSSVHAVWVIRYSSTLESRILYAPSDVFLTLPQPKRTAEMAELGQELEQVRRELMLGRSWGLTATYNHVHDPDDHDPAVVQLRDIHAAIDEAVMRAYGWEDLELKIGHHPTKIGIRWTVGKEARFELLDRLLEENLRRYKLENP